jgi:hypothetical protein
MSSNLVRWGVPGAVLAGAAFVLLSLSSLAISGPSPYFDISFLIAWLLTIPGVVGLHAAQSESYGLLGRVGCVSLIAGVIANTIGLVPLAFGNESLLWLSFPVGALLLLIGFLSLGIATLRAGVLPRWSGVALIVALPLVVVAGAIFGAPTDEDYPGVVVMGLVWLALGHALWARVGVTSERPSRVN